MIFAATIIMIFQPNNVFMDILYPPVLIYFILLNLSLIKWPRIGKIETETLFFFLMHGNEF